MLETDKHESGVASLGGWMRALALPRTSQPREWVGLSQGHEIRVMTHGRFQARLYIDGELRDCRRSLLGLNRKMPLLSGRLPTARTEVTIVYVYPRGWFPMTVEVRVAGKPIPMNPCTPPAAES